MVEKPRIRKPGADHPLIAGNNRLAAVLGLEISHQEELVDQLGMGGVAQHETFLVIADRGADNFFRDLQETLIERAHQNDRPFDQPRRFREQALVLDQFEPLREGKLFRFGEDDAAPPFGVEHHFGLIELCCVIGEAAHGESVRGKEAMATG